MDMNETKPVICIVDDDKSVRRALARLVESMDMRAESFESPEELLETGPSDEVGCFLFDVQLPGMDGFELHERVLAGGLRRPVIFLTAHPDGRKRDRARAAGATAYLEKPFDEEALLNAIRLALSSTVDSASDPPVPSDRLPT
jgi:FixJ family two-component response regulator